MNLFWRIVLGWFAFVLGLGLAVVVVTVAGTYQIPSFGQQIILATVTTGVAVPLIYVLRRFADQRPWRGLGLSSTPSGLPYLLLGAGFLAAMTAASLLIGSALGWLQVVDFHLPPLTLFAILINVPIAFFYEALPEELTFRGYLYSNLKTKFSCWLSLILQIVLFVLAPIALTAGMVAAGIGTWDLISFNYVINLLVFGIVLQLCRILSGNLWMNIGFHLAYLEMIRYVVVPADYGLVEIKYLTPSGSYLLSLGPSIVGIIVLVTWYLRKNAVKRNGLVPEDLPESEDGHS